MTSKKGAGVGERDDVPLWAAGRTRAEVMAALETVRSERDRAAEVRRLGPLLDEALRELEAHDAPEVVALRRRRSVIPPASAQLDEPRARALAELTADAWRALLACGVRTSLSARLGAATLYADVPAWSSVGETSRGEASPASPHETGDPEPIARASAGPPPVASRAVGTTNSIRYSDDVLHVAGVFARVLQEDGPRHPRTHACLRALALVLARATTADAESVDE